MFQRILSNSLWARPPREQRPTGPLAPHASQAPASGGPSNPARPASPSAGHPPALDKLGELGKTGPANGGPYPVLEGGYVVSQDRSRIMGRIDAGKWTEAGLPFEDIQPPAKSGDAWGSKTADLMEKNRKIFEEKSRLNNSRAKGQLPDGQAFSMVDRPYMKPLVAASNAKHPGLNLHYADGVPQSVDKALMALPASGPGHARIVCYDVMGSHHFAIDFRRHDGGAVTAIAVDSLQRRDFDRIEKAMKSSISQGKVDAFSMFYTATQASDHGCGVFALDFAKTMAAEQPAMAALHRKALEAAHAFPRGSAPPHSTGSMQVYDHNQAFRYLPIRFLKNVQSGGSLRFALKVSPDPTANINKKGETVPGRLERITKFDMTDRGQVPSTADKVRPLDKTRIRLYESGEAHIKGLLGGIQGQDN